MSNGTLPQPPLPPQPTSLYQKIIAAKELWHLNKFNMQSWLNQRSVKKLQDGTLGQIAEGDLEMPGDIKVGDSYPIIMPPNQPQQSSGIGTVGTVALTAASILGMGGIAGGAAYLMNKLMSPAPVVSPVTPPTPQNPNFTDTSTDIGLVK